uniref:Integrase catalytic domain-containing protein n=1 Tax=Nicotiana tabacum TaxID=4097 RepID=A0A1S4A259_TOBAC|nr:PREDICTED: uncharacterized protein LOC107793016 [Nicotiana tabacum]
MSGTKPDVRAEAIKDSDIVEAYMLGIPRDIATHMLNIDLFYPPVWQMRRKFNAAINEAVNEEVGKLLANGSIRESKYPQWVMLINATVGYELLSFLDAYSGYNQILMAEEDHEKTTFITHRGTYYYKVMSFGLKNAGATYQRLVTKMFKEQLGKTMEVYINDILVKSTKKKDHIGHMKEAFKLLRQYGMKLNPEKCTFGVTSGKFLGFLVSQRGIEVNPDQIRAVDAISEILTSKNRLIAYLQDGMLLQDKKEAKKLWVQAAIYNLVNGDLYKRTFDAPLAKCLGTNQTRRVLEEVYEGHCGAHTGNRTLVRCLIHVRYYWPTMKKEVADYVRRCEQCAYTQIREQEVIAFIWKTIICRFGIPKEIGCDNRPQFFEKKMTEFFEKWHIKRILSTPYHPAGNCQAKSCNKVTLNILKKSLRTLKSYGLNYYRKYYGHTSLRQKPAPDETPYSLVYGTDTVIPVEVEEPSLRYSNENGPSNDESRLHDLDEVEEWRDMAHIRMVAQKQQIERYYNKKAKVRPLKVGDYILKAKTQAAKDPNKGKLGTNWDGSYKITATTIKGAFQLETMEGKLLQNN